jgi:hypothetical protein
MFVRNFDLVAPIVRSLGESTGSLLPRQTVHEGETLNRYFLQQPWATDLIFPPAPALFRSPVPAHWWFSQWSAGHPPLTDVLSGVLPGHRMPTHPAGQSNRLKHLRGAGDPGRGISGRLSRAWLQRAVSTTSSRATASGPIGLPLSRRRLPGPEQNTTSGVAVDEESEPSALPAQSEQVAPGAGRVPSTRYDWAMPRTHGL